MAKKKSEKSHIRKELLLNLLKGGAVLTAALITPGLVKLSKSNLYGSCWEEYYPSSLERATIRLWRKGLVEIFEGKETAEVRITDKGKLEVLRFNLESLEIKREHNWDKKWRMVIFDIPDKDKAKRELFREKLKTLGFIPMQESVFVYPYPCEKEVKFMREVLGIAHFVKLLRVDLIENDGELRKIFNL